MSNLAYTVECDTNNALKSIEKMRNFVKDKNLYFDRIVSKFCDQLSDKWKDEEGIQFYNNLIEKKQALNQEFSIFLKLTDSMQKTILEYDSIMTEFKTKVEKG